MPDEKNSAVGLWRTYDVEQDRIEMLRVACFEYANANPNKVDIDDVRARIDSPEDVTNNNIRFEHDWMLKRLLISAHRDVDQALNKFIAFFQFRKEYHVNKMTKDNILPQEFYHLLPLDDAGHDKEGHRVLVIRLKYYKKIPQFDLLIRRAIIYFAEMLDIQYENEKCKGIVLFFDCFEFRVSQLDMDLLKFAILSIPGHYSGLIRYIIVCDLPFLLSYVFKIVESWVPSEKNSTRKFIFSISRKQVDQFIDCEERADFLGGKRVLDRTIPKDAKDIDSFMKEIEDLDPQNTKKISSYVHELMQTYK